MGKFDVETQTNTASLRDLVSRLKLFGKNQKEPVEPTLPSGLTVAEALGKFEAIVGAIEVARRQQESVPADLKLTDFEISATSADKKGFEARLLTSATNRATQPRQQDQAALSRLIYQLIVGEPLNSSGIRAALGQLTIPTPEHPTLPEAVEVIERGLQNLYSSTSELNGAFGWAMYRYAQATIQHRQSNIAVQPSLQNLSYVEWQLENQNAPLPKTLKRNFAVIAGLIGVGVLTIICLIIVANKPTLFGNQPPKQAVAASTTATTAVSKTAPSTTTQPTTPNSVQNINGGITSYQVDVNQAKAASPEISQLKVGQAAVWNPPNVAVTGITWQDNIFLYVATDDGNYTDYESHTSEKVVSTINGLQNDDKLACWSPNGKNLAVLTTANQVLLKSSDNAMKVGASFQLPIEINNISEMVYNSCQSLFSWSPNSQKLLVFSTIPEMWVFSKQAIQQVGTDKTMTYDLNNNNTVWSPDSNLLGVFVQNDGQGTEEIFNIYDASNWNWNSSIKIPIAPFSSNKTPEIPGQQFSISNPHWSPDGRSIASILEAEEFNSDQSVYTESVQIFTLPKDISAQGQPLDPDLLQTNTIITTTAPFPYVVTPNLAWSPDNSKIAVFNGNFTSTTRLDTFMANQTGAISVYSVNKNDNTNFLYKWNTENYIANYLTWNPEGDNLLTADSTGSLRVWSLPKNSNAKGEVNSIYFSLNQRTDNKLGTTRNALQWSPDGKYLAVTDFTFLNTVKFFSGVNGQPLIQTNLQQQNLQLSDQAGQWSPDGRFFGVQVFDMSVNPNSNLPDTEVAVWEVENNQADFYGLVPLQVPYNFGRDNLNSQVVTALLPQWTFNADAKNPEILLLDSTGDVYSYDLASSVAQTSTQVVTPKPTSGKTGQAVGQKVINNNSAAISNTTTTQAIKIGHFMGINFNTTFIGSWSNRRDAVITGADGHFKLYYITLLNQNYGDFQSFEVFPEQPQRVPQVMRIVFSPDDALVAFGLTNGTVRVFNTSSGKLVTTVIATSANLTDIAFSPDGKHLTTAASDREVKLWKVSEQGYWPLDQLLQGDTSAITHVAFSSDSRHLLTQDGAGGVLVWRLN